MEVAAALLDASRKLSEKETSTGNVSTASGSSWNSSNNELSDKSPTSWFSNPWAGQRKRALSETVCSAEKQATMSWLGQGSTTININIPNQEEDSSRARRASYKGIETAMAGGLGKVWYDS